MFQPFRLPSWIGALALPLLGCSRPGELRSGEPVTEESATQRAPLERKPAEGNDDQSRPAAPFLERVEERHRLVEQLQAEGIDDARVIAAMRRVPRHHFVPEEMRADAYEDRPLPIGSGQTISQPYIVATMTQAVAPKPADRCLEIGTGSGYQAAVLAELCKETYSIEYLPEVAALGASNLRTLGYGVQLRVGDGYAGWPEAAPFDVIVVTAAPQRVPQPLLDQLADGGRLIIPVGPQHGSQMLELWTRIKPGPGQEAFERRSLMGVRFVPFLGEEETEQVAPGGPVP